MAVFAVWKPKKKIISFKFDYKKPFPDSYYYEFNYKRVKTK